MPQREKPAFAYRPDIDGLRAIAVLSVVACHLNLRKFQGGYVGVDIFFVISGYLISSIVFAEIASSKFSIAAFYERRIRRIFPALFAMFVVFSAFAWRYFLPIELIAYAKSLLAATFSISNFYFWKHSGYFDSPLSNPLLHTWSLAVEEQFYILFPLFLVLARRFSPSRLRLSVVVLFVLSFLGSILAVHYSRNTAFYMIYTRAWELLLGTMLALKIFPESSLRWLHHTASVIGLALMAWPIHNYTKDTVFPGLAALAPCLGAALIIWAGTYGPSIVGRILSWRPIVFVGLISYSLYLWHWPIIILRHMGLILNMEQVVPAKYVHLVPLATYNNIASFVASIVVAILSWKFVERPFRSGGLRLQGKPLFAMAGTLMIVFAALSSFMVLEHGMRNRFAPRSLQLAAYIDSEDAQKAMRVGSCFITSQQHFDSYQQDVCLQAHPGRKNFLLLGDSHSAMLWPGLHSSYPNLNIMQASTSGCVPAVHPTGGVDCVRMMKFIYEQYLPEHKIDGVLLSARWGQAQLGRLDATLQWAHEHQIPFILFGPIQEYDSPLPRLEAYASEWKDPELIKKHRVAGYDVLDHEYAVVAKRWNVPYISLYQAACRQDNCLEYVDAQRTVPLLDDTDHLSPEGSLFLIQQLAKTGELKLDNAQFLEGL